MSIIAKRAGQKHFTFPVAPNVGSDRVVLPTKDGCRLKITRFRPLTGFVAENIIYPWDESVFVANGAIVVRSEDTLPVQLNQGSVYVIPANTKYTLVVQMSSVLICTFSAVPGGPPVDDR